MASTRQHGAEKLCDWFSDKLICICDGLSIILVQRAGEALLPHTSGSRTIPSRPPPVSAGASSQHKMVSGAPVYLSDV